MLVGLDMRESTAVLISMSAMKVIFYTVCLYVTVNKMTFLCSGRCGDNGRCVNTIGSFICDCNQNHTGRFCQFERKCNPGLCPSGMYI